MRSAVECWGPVGLRGSADYVCVYVYVHSQRPASFGRWRPPAYALDFTQQQLPCRPRTGGDKRSLIIIDTRARLSTRRTFNGI